MPAPTAILRRPDQLAESVVEPSSTTQGTETDTEQANVTALAVSRPQVDEDAGTAMNVDSESAAPRFAPQKDTKTTVPISSRKIPIPPHRFAPLKTAWPQIYPPIVEHLHLDVKMHLSPKSRAVEIRTNKQTTDTGALQKGEDFIKAFTLGFDTEDAIALLRLDDLYIETFEIKDVKTLQGEHMGRAIGRIAGKDGRTKFAIENASRTRVVLADQKIHILGQFRNIGVAREAIVSLILGSPPSKVYGNLRTVSARMKERW